MSARLHDRLPVPEPSRHEERPLDAYSVASCRGFRAPFTRSSWPGRKPKEFPELTRAGPHRQRPRTLGNVSPERDDVAIVAEPTAAYRTRKRARATSARKARKIYSGGAPRPGALGESSRRQQAEERGRPARRSNVTVASAPASRPVPPMT